MRKAALAAACFVLEALATVSASFVAPTAGEASIRQCCHGSKQRG